MRLRKRKLGCLEGSRDMQQPVKRCRVANRHVVDLQRIHSEDEKKNEKKTISFDDAPIPSKTVKGLRGKRKRSQTPWKKQAQSVELGENLVGSRIKVLWPRDKKFYLGVVINFDRIKNRHKILYDDGDEELIDLKRQKWEVVTNVSPMSDCLGMAIHKKVSSPLSSIICVQGYNVNRSVAPILEAIFKKYGDIAAECVFQTDSVRTYFVEVVCEIVRRIQSNDVTTIISESEEIECRVSDVEAAKLNVSWLRGHLKAIHKRKEVLKESTLLLEVKENISLVKMDVQMYLRERCAKFVAAQYRFEKAERCVEVLDHVEKKLNKDILEHKAEKDSWTEQRIILELPKEVSSSQGGTICVQGYNVKQSVALILEAIFKKHGDVAAECIFKTASVRSSLLEIVCEVVRQIQIKDVTTIISEMEDIERRVSDVEAAKINVAWIRAHLKTIHKRKEAKQNSTLLMNLKVNAILVKRAAQMDLKERRVELVAAKELLEKDLRSVNVLGLLEKKVNNDILELKDEQDSWVEQPIL